MKNEDYRMDSQDCDALQDQVIRYKAPWEIFALGICQKPQFPFRMGIGSYSFENNNQAQIIQLNQANQFQRVSFFEQKQGITKLMFIPDKLGDKPDILATTGQSLKIWEINHQNDVSLKCNLGLKNNFSAPLTSLDWMPKTYSWIGVSSINSVCTLWDIEKQTIAGQLICHEKQVCDIQFTNHEYIFITAGGDGKINQFDMRQPQARINLYKSCNKNAILKLALDRNSDRIAFTQMQSKQVKFIDTRFSQQTRTKPVPRIKQQDRVNSLVWAPQSEDYLCTAGDDRKAKIWDISPGLQNAQTKMPILQYEAVDKITNLAWANSKKDCISLCNANQVELVRI